LRIFELVNSFTKFYCLDFSTYQNLKDAHNKQEKIMQSSLEIFIVQMFQARKDFITY